MIAKQDSGILTGSSTQIASEGCAPSSLGPPIILFETVQNWTVIVDVSVHDVHRRAFV